MATPSPTVELLEELYDAISDNKTGSVFKLLQAGKCSPSAFFETGSKPTPLIHAAALGHRHCLQILLMYKARIDARDAYDVTACMRAAEEGHLGCLQDLVGAGANVNLSDRTGCTALMRAAQWGKTECTEFLLGKVKNKDFQETSGRTALMFAAKNGHCECLLLLAKSGACLDLVDDKGSSALMLAVERQEYACASNLLQQGANPDIINANGKTALSLTVEFQWGDYKAFLLELLRTGARVDITERNQQCLHQMIARGFKKILRQMILNGCGPVALDCRESYYRFPHQNFSISPLATAILTGRTDVANYLIMSKFLLPQDLSKLTLYRNHSQQLRQDLQQQQQQRQQRQDLDTEIGDDAEDDVGIVEDMTNLVNDLYEQPMSLFMMSFVKTSSLLGFAEGREKRISALPLPCGIKDQLVFATSSVRLCTSCWHRLQLGREYHVEPCLCADCQASGGGALIC